MSPESWANSIRGEEYHNKPEHQQAINIIQNLLERNSDSESAALAIASAYEPSIQRREKVSAVATLWGIICNAAKALCNNVEYANLLVNLLNSISKLPDVVDNHGNPITPSWTSAGVYWKDLPEFATIFRDYGIDIEPIDDREPEPELKGDAAKYLNATTFGATYLAHGSHSSMMALHAEVSLMEGIEVQYQTPEQQQRAAMYVCSAATWLLLAGERIYELCEVNHDKKNGAPGFSSSEDDWLWKKSRGFGLDRWAFWKQRFGEIVITQGLSNEVKEVATRAVSKMAEIETRRI